MLYMCWTHFAENNFSFLIRMAMFYRFRNTNYKHTLQAKGTGHFPAWGYQLCRTGPCIGASLWCGRLALAFGYQILETCPPLGDPWATTS